MAQLSKWYKNNPGDRIWWLDTSEKDGEWIFSFDKKIAFNMFRDYPDRLTKDELEAFNKENPYWADFFEGRK